MPPTTIKVDSAVRDRLAEVARAQGKTMGALLADVADRLAAEQRDREVREACARMQRDDPQGWQDYLHELTVVEFDAAADGSAADEWPEYQ